MIPYGKVWRCLINSRKNISWSNFKYWLIFLSSFCFYFLLHSGYQWCFKDVWVCKSAMQKFNIFSSLAMMYTFSWLNRRFIIGSSPSSWDANKKIKVNELWKMYLLMYTVWWIIIIHLEAAVQYVTLQIYNSIKKFNRFPKIIFSYFQRE